jgi:hypothetical protein
MTLAGRRIWVRSVGQAVRDSTGSIRRVERALQDISERRQAEEETRQLGVRHKNERSEVSLFFALNPSV